MSKPGFTPKQARFIEEYPTDLNATAAARRAGYTHPHVQGPRLLGHVRVAAAIQRALQKRAKRTEITQELVLEELRRIAVADVRNLFTWDEERACYVPSKDLTPEQAAAISGVEAETIEIDGGDGPPKRKIKLKLKTYDKLRALEMLGRHLGIWNDAAANVTVPIFILGSDRELAKPVEVKRNGAPAENGRS